MNDELRDRIWTVIADTLCPGNGGYRLLEYREAAQAIIDELRLEREASPINVDCVRYVSKWELRKH